MLRQPVDKSVVKLWKECPERRNYWPLAIPALSTARTFLGRVHGVRIQVKQKTLDKRLQPLHGGALRVSSCPQRLWTGLWIR